MSSGGGGGGGATPEQMAEQMAAAIKAMEDQLEMVIRNEEAAVRARAAAVSAVESVRQISGNGAGGATSESPSETLLAIGGGVFVQAKVAPSDKMLMEIGSGVAVEKDPKHVLDYLENRIREIDVAIKNTGAEKTSLAEHIEQYRMQLNQVIQSAYGQRGHV